MHLGYRSRARLKVDKGMKKQGKKKTIRVDSGFWVILGVVGLFVSIIVLRSSQLAFSWGNNGNWNGNGYGNGYGYNQNQNNSDDDNDNLPTQQPTQSIQPTITQTPIFQMEAQSVVAVPTPSPTTVITPTLTPVVTPTISQKTSEPVVQPTLSPNTFKIPGSSEEIVVVQEVIEVKPITGGTSTTAPVVQKSGGGSILKTIKDNILSVGKVAPTATPKPTPTVPVPGKGKPEVPLNKLKLKYEITSGQVVMSSFDESGYKVAVDETDLRGVETYALSNMQKKGIALSTTGDNMFVVGKNGILATTKLPVMIDMDTKELKLVTSSGSKTLTTLPDKALKNILDLGLITGVDTKHVPTIDISGSEIYYTFSGDRVYKMLGLFDVTVPVNIQVSVETGDVISGDQPWITKTVRMFTP